MCRKKFQETRKYTVKLSVGNSVSTGVVFAPEVHDYLYVFTTLHSLENFFNPENLNPSIEFSFYNGNNDKRIGEVSQELEFISLLEKEKIILEDISECEGTDRDIVVLRIPSNIFEDEERQKVKFPKLKIAFQNDVEDEKCLYGAGYPNDSAVPEELTAIKNAFIGNRYHLKCTLDNINEFEEMMKGYSGSGLFVNLDDNSLRLIGLVSGCNDQEKNNYFYAVPLNKILDKMEKKGWPTPRNEKWCIPDSIENYIDAAADFFDVDFSKNEHEAVKMGLEDLQKLGLNPACFYREKREDKFASIRCCDSILSCKNYWKGQLIKAFCFCDVNGESIENLADLKYSFKKTFFAKNENIKIEFVCSKKTPGDFVRHLFEQKFYMGDSKIEDGSIFVWNGNGEKTAYTKSYGRKSINGICRNLLASNNTKVDSNGRKMLDGTEYNIVNGDVPYFNFAIIGTQELADSVINNSDGDKMKMKKNLSEVMKDTWGKDNE